MWRPVAIFTNMVALLLMLIADVTSFATNVCLMKNTYVVSGKKNRRKWWQRRVCNELQIGLDNVYVTSWIFLLCFNVPVFIILGFTVSQLSFLGSRLASVLLWVSREASCLIGWSRAQKPIRSCYWLVFRGRSNTDTERLNTNWVRQNALEPARGRLPWALLGAKPHGKCDIAYISRMPDIL